MQIQMHATATIEQQDKAPDPHKLLDAITTGCHMPHFQVVAIAAGFQEQPAASLQPATHAAEVQDDTGSDAASAIIEQQDKASDPHNLPAFLDANTTSCHMPHYHVVITVVC